MLELHLVPSFIQKIKKKNLEQKNVNSLRQIVKKKHKNRFLKISLIYVLYILVSFMLVCLQSVQKIAFYGHDTNSDRKLSVNDFPHSIRSRQTRADSL